MARAKPPYRKLTGLYRTVGAMSRLWLGSDHLLHVNSTGYTESYRRLYLRDIQAMLLVHTGRRTYLHLAVGVIASILLFAFVTTGAPWGFYAVFGGIALALMIWNHLLGGGCRVVIVTAVQQENVPALCRVPRTRRVLAELSPLIHAAQADLLVAAPGTEPPPLESGPATPPTLPPFPVS